MPPHCLIAIKAIPNAPRHEVVGWLGDAITVQRGDTSRLKSVRVEGLAAPEVHARLGLARLP
jgi:uncharacterized protein YggU (UPF0235/DUF167 family)